jgi:hypothetical protein
LPLRKIQPWLQISEGDELNLGEMVGLNFDDERWAFSPHSLSSRHLRRLHPRVRRVLEIAPEEGDSGETLDSDVSPGPAPEVL